MSRPTVSKAKTSYPLYAALWAPSAPSTLIVGGGGGAGRHGVKNKISVFDFSTRAPIVEEPVAELEASEHDSVTCLAGLGTKGGVVVYAGINDAEGVRLEGGNESLKGFEVRFGDAGKKGEKEGAKGKIEYLSKTRLFKVPEGVGARKEGYQRVVRVSRNAVQGTAADAPTTKKSNASPKKKGNASATATAAQNKRIGAVASSLQGDENEIVIFAATSNKPENAKDVIQRITLHKGQEANDLDILDLGEGRFAVAYCLDNDVYVQSVRYDFGKRKSLGKGDADRKHLYTVPLPDLSQKKARAKIRCLRWLSASHILLLANKPNRSGAELLVLRLYEEGPGQIVLRKTFPRHVQAAVDMDVALLDADVEGAYQAVIAVAAIDVSLSVLTVDYLGRERNELSRFCDFATYYNVHELQMTKAVFSPFIKPESSPDKKPATQYLRLATTSLGNSIDVETFELQRLSSKSQSRYVLQNARSKTLVDTAKYIVIAMIVAAVALILQGFLDPEGSITKRVLPESVQNVAAGLKPPGAAIEEARSAALLNAANSPTAKTTSRLHNLLHLHKSAALVSEKALVVHHDPDSDGTLSAEVHDAEHDVVQKHTEAKRWEELDTHEKRMWRKKLVDAGMWAVEEGETVLKGVFFSEAAHVVGGLAAGVIG